MAGGRPSKKSSLDLKQVERLARKGWTDEEMIHKLRCVGASQDEASATIARCDCDDDFLDAWRTLYHQDRSGVIALRKERRKRRRAAEMRDPGYRLENATRARIWASLKANRTGRGGLSGLPYSLSDLRRHLEERFAPGMTWENYGKWHVDHVRPCASFDMSDAGDFEECWALENLQPLWASENLKKGAKIGAP